ncbi:MAG: M28 family peptidase [Clostridiales bacterium]|nr:M28 family peptidase [Clostridiales bacterium]
MSRHSIASILLWVAFTLVSCGGQKSNQAQPAMEATTCVETFNTDSAMSYLKAQTDLGPRVPGSEAHRLCGDYLAATLRRLGADTVIEHTAHVTAWNGDRLPLRNIIARFGSRDGVKPVLLAAHWDSRPWADAESDPVKSRQPIDGANDGASGVAVLLETARLAGINGTLMPIEILLCDGEDYGKPGDGDGSGDESTWCLGTQAWLSTFPYANRERPRYAILLDMVGGRNARFHREYISQRLAPGVVDMVWNTAASIGLGERFVNSEGGAVVDDHLFINRAGIPAIDIIENKNPETGSFNVTWHTHEDSYENIDPSTIGDTGRLVSKLTIKE